jgi:hypothetical protein
MREGLNGMFEPGMACGRIGESEGPTPRYEGARHNMLPIVG